MGLLPFLGRIILSAALCAVASGTLVAMTGHWVSRLIYGPGHFSGISGAYAFFVLIVASIVWGGLAGGAMALRRRNGLRQVLCHGAVVTGAGIALFIALAAVLQKVALSDPPTIDGRRTAVAFAIFTHLPAACRTIRDQRLCPYS